VFFGMALLKLLIALALAHATAAAAAPAASGRGSKPHILMVVVDGARACPPLASWAAPAARRVVSGGRQASSAGLLRLCSHGVCADLGWHNVGWHNPDMLTPNSDKLVAEGVELDRHYVYMCE